MIRIAHVYSQAPARIWRALTDPAVVARWWAPGDIRPEVGHRFEMDMGVWGKQPCEVLAVEPERLLRFVLPSGPSTRSSRGSFGPKAAARG